MKKRIISILLCLLLLAGCAPAKMAHQVILHPSPRPSASVPRVRPTVTAAPESDFSLFARQVNEKRKSRMVWTSTDKRRGPQFSLEFPKWQETAWTAEEIELLQNPDRPAASLTLEQAREDVATFFKLLQTTYGGYDYFGGDKVFLPLMDEAMKRLESYDLWDGAVLEEVLSNLLAPVLRDGHMRIGSTTTRDRHMAYMYYVPDIYLDDPANLDMDYVKPTIGPDGAITYCFAAMSHDGSELPSSLGGHDLNWTRAETVPNNGAAYGRAEVGGVPVMQCYSLSETEENRGHLDELAKAGGDWTEYPLFLMDLRSNRGGNSTYAAKWFRGFTGKRPQTKSADWQKESQLHLDFAVREWNMHEADAEKVLGMWNGGRVDGVWVENDAAIFVLTDKNVASSGEYMVEFMRTVDNTIFVGGPTMGCKLVGNVMNFYLPHTGMRIYMGTSLSLFETNENMEGVGILPDLWVNPTDAQDAVLRLIDHYGLREE